MERGRSFAGKRALRVGDEGVVYAESATWAWHSTGKQWKRKKQPAT